MSNIMHQAVDVVSQTPYQRDTVTTAEVIVIPADMQDQFCEFTAIAQDVAIRFGTSDSVGVTIAQASGLASGVLSANAATPHILVPAGRTVVRRIPGGKWSHFAHRSGATGGRLLFGSVTGKGTTEDSGA
jgi:hypothetical protein